MTPDTPQLMEFYPLMGKKKKWCLICCKWIDSPHCAEVERGGSIHARQTHPLSVCLILNVTLECCLCLPEGLWKTICDIRMLPLSSKGLWKTICDIRMLPLSSIGSMIYERQYMTLECCFLFQRVCERQSVTLVWLECSFVFQRVYQTICDIRMLCPSSIGLWKTLWH